jgi:hypothetical protein
VKIKDREPLYQGLIQAKQRYDKIRALFDGMQEQAKVIETPDFHLPGITMEPAGKAAFRASFLGSTIRVRFVYDRGSGKGIVVVDDISDASDDAADVREIAVELWRFTFNGQGETDLRARNDGDTYNLHSVTDCAEIVLAALDSALDRDRSAARP